MRLKAEVVELKAERESERQYHRALLDSILLKNYIKPVEEQIVAPAPTDSSKPQSFDEWTKEDEDAEIEERAWSAANDDLQFKIVEEAATFDPRYKPVLERARQIRSQLN